ncbi:MAG TPA: polyribonucleotide nucleotidyltransferase [Bacteroidales bacterium]|jgi:polyribonucleotide nucleotidyltransferase|nr:polyribonucleotide nucleotidyltransferase [Bacteroidota bacterium]MZP65582.1 polyribonucleotide nucleotidyltransferase [Bacteroidales bacterium]NLK54822.1 polyribonucleotide nucleotidyltransferase [Bacteroidales bacterium]HOG57450.1 polyribonucleotide nucleotidyltransferase [Bacteroidales bacterium]HPV16260.1 polyribonucleotide nucleotidyltransferase [Bacteroidales bacterium]
MFNIKEKNIDLGDGRIITLETGKMARQADGAVLLKMGKTMLLATVVSAKDAREDTDFIPLSVEYKEKYASSGRIPGGFLKREARPSDYEILISRLVDRALRPLFPNDYHAETFVTINLISADIDIIPDALAGLAASAALSISDIPFNGPMSEVRVARINGSFIVNPTATQLKDADMDLMVGATFDNILMVEGEMKEVSEADMIEALRVAHQAIKVQCRAQMEFAGEAGKGAKREYCHEENDEDLKKKVWDETYDKCYQVAKSAIADKHKREEAFTEVIEGFLSQYSEEDEVNVNLVGKYYNEVVREAARRLVLDEGIRLDGRKSDQIRPIVCEIDPLPATHGSSLFTRGETQSLTTVTLGTKLDEKIIDDVLNQGTEKFTLHYNFPPFSTGEAKPARGVSRREIGHGNLAHRALKNMMPPDTENPYTVRVVSDILESNGSSSMATVCAGTLALMDAGVQLRKPVSGIAMGLISDQESGKYAILSDILGDEDHLGDMDFKVTGTRDGITATQMDIKVEGLSFEVLTKALDQAREGRMHILDIMKNTIESPRPELKPHAPRIEMLTIPKDMIGALIGPGGKVIQEIQRETGTTIVVEEVNGCGDVNVFGENKEAITAALEWIKRIVAVPEVGQVYKGKVKTIVQFGAFVEILPNKDGLLHISEIDWKKVRTVDEVLKVGDEVEVKLIDIDPKTGKLKLSRKVLLPRPPREEGGERHWQGNRKN